MEQLESYSEQAAKAWAANTIQILIQQPPNIPGNPCTGLMAFWYGYRLISVVACHDLDQIINKLGCEV